MRSRNCNECDEELIPGEDWPEGYQDNSIYVHRTCDLARPNKHTDDPKNNPKKNDISRVMHERMGDIPRKDHYKSEHEALRKQLRKEIDADGSWQKGTTEPKTVPNVKPDRLTTKVPVPEPKWYMPTPREKLSESPTRKALRRNKLVDFDACELSSYGPAADLEFHHTLDFAVCAHLYKRLDWAADINNGFLMIGCLNNPMKRGFHWEMDGPCAYYVPPEGEDYPDWMKVLRIPHFWIEPTPEQVKYILLASDHAMGIMY